jgi:hypothetical protein
MHPKHLDMNSWTLGGLQRFCFGVSGYHTIECYIPARGSSGGMGQEDVHLPHSPDIYRSMGSVEDSFCLHDYCAFCNELDHFQQTKCLLQSINSDSNFLSSIWFMVPQAAHAAASGAIRPSSH